MKVYARLADGYGSSFRHGHMTETSTKWLRRSTLIRRTLAALDGISHSTVCAARSRRNQQLMAIPLHVGVQVSGLPSCFATRTAPEEFRRTFDDAAKRRHPRRLSTHAVHPERRFRLYDVFVQYSPILILYPSVFGSGNQRLCRWMSLLSRLRLQSLWRYGWPR
jgi:hypothetical protein